MVQVPQGIVDRRRRQQEHVAPLAPEQFAQHRGAGRRVRVAVVVRLVDDNELVLLQGPRELVLILIRIGAGDLAIDSEFFIGQAFDVAEEMRRAEFGPGRVSQLRRANEKAPLTPLEIEVHHLAGDERLTESHLVGNDRSADFVDEP